MPAATPGPTTTCATSKTRATDGRRLPERRPGQPDGGFPTEGATYGILTTRQRGLGRRPQHRRRHGVRLESRQPGDRRASTTTSREDRPAGREHRCLAFDFRFLSDEFPEYVGTQYNDAFIAQLDTWSIAVDPPPTVTAPGNFAGGAATSSRSTQRSERDESTRPALGTTYDGATTLLTARAPVTAGSANSLYLTIFDQGDAILDSAVFLDNMRFETIDPTKCKSLRADPAEGMTGVSPVPGNPPKLSKDKSTLTFPVSCNLPPGPVSCTVTASAGFIPTPGRVATGRDAALAAVTPLASGSATIAPNTTGAITMGTTNAGVKAIKTAIKKPAKLKAQAKQLLKKAKKLRAEGKIAKAKELEAKAAKLIKRAKKLARKPLGVIKTTITNPANGASQTFKTVLKRP